MEIRKISEKRLHEIWKKYIDQKIYRIMPFDQKEIILKKGMNPKKDPYEKINNDIKKMFKIILKLEKKGIIFTQIWGKKKKIVKGSLCVKISMRSVKEKYIDFVADKKQIKRFEKKWSGGCLIHYVFSMSEFLIENKDKLSKTERNLVKKLYNWSKKKRTDKKFVISIKGSSRTFESAKFYCFNPKFKRYWKSPFGSFKNFKKVIKEKGLKRYLPYLKQEKLFYLRVIEKIHPNEIKLIK